jgi:hypothetical protein
VPLVGVVRPCPGASPPGRLWTHQTQGHVVAALELVLVLVLVVVVVLALALALTLALALVLDKG